MPSQSSPHHLLPAPEFIAANLCLIASIDVDVEPSDERDVDVDAVDGRTGAARGDA